MGNMLEPKRNYLAYFQSSSVCSSYEIELNIIMDSLFLKYS